MAIEKAKQVLDEVLQRLQSPFDGSGNWKDWPPQKVKDFIKRVKAALNEEE